MVRKLIHVIFLLFALQANAQTSILSNEFIQKQLSRYSKANPQVPLFLHIDKMVYTNNETIWFSAYLINRTPSELALHTVLSVCIFKDDTRKIWLEQKYLMENGLASGSLLLPDSIPSGNYHLMAYTNRIDKDGYPSSFYAHTIQVKNITSQSFSSTVRLLDSSFIQGHVRVKVTVNTNDAKSRTLPFVEYRVGNGAVHKVAMKDKELLVELPEKEIANGNAGLLVTVRYNQEVQYLSARLPAAKSDKINIRFFPEGGDLAHGLPSIVALEARSEQGAGISLTGLLYKDNQIIDTVQTNSYGAGSFRLEPDDKSKYLLKIKSGSYLKRDTAFELPKISSNNLVVSIRQAVSDDTLKVTLYSKQKAALQLLIHNNQGAYLLLKINSSINGHLLRIPLNVLPKGLATLTVLDDKGAPLTERLFFAHYNDYIAAKIVIEKASYGKHDLVNVKVRLTDTSGSPVQGLVSISAVQDNRLKTTFQDIETYSYLAKDLGTLPPDPSGQGFRNKAYLEDMLLIRGWRRYTWGDIINNDKNQNVPLYSSPDITGQVAYKGKPLKEAVNLIALGSAVPGLIPTTNNGLFKLDLHNLLLDGGKKIALMVSNSNGADYRITVRDPYFSISQKFAEQMDIPLAENNLTNSSDQDLKGIERTINLQTVTIKGDRSGSTLTGFKGEPGINACGDYVDEHDYLNYEFSVNKFKPVIGKMYKKRIDLNGTRTSFKVEPASYFGCQVEENKDVLKLNGIYKAKEFYGVNNDPGELQYLSTLFWKTGILTDTYGEIEFTFRTGDIADRFRIILQGLTNENVVYGDSSFIVK